MKRGIVLTFLLVLFLVPVLYSPVNLALSSDVLPPLAEPNMQKDFVMSADGAESSESITSFMETLSDDVLYYPDAFLSDYPIMATAGVFTGTGEYNTWENTTSDTAIFWNGDSDADEELIFVSDYSIEYFNYMTKIGAAMGQDPDLMIWNFTSSAWVKIEDIANTAWYNDTVTDSCFWNSTNHVRLQIDNDADDAAKWYYAELNFCTMLLADSEHFAESFYVVSDWTTSDTSIITDDDVATITENGAGSTGRAYASFASTDFFEYYYEFQISTMTATTAKIEFWDGAAYNTLKTFTAAGTFKGIISDTDAATMQRIGFLVGSEGGNIKPDYLRISQSTEMGFSHDGSTTAGWVAEDDECAYTISTDGDIITANMTYDDTESWVGWSLYTDTTATVCTIERDYYQFYEMNVSVAKGSGYMSTGDVGIWMQYDDYGEALNTWDEDNTDWTILGGNIKASTQSRAGRYYFSFYAQIDAGESVEFKLDYLKLYSIANFTITQSGATIDDYLYVDAGVLYSSVDDGYIEANHDPVLAVNGATYPIYNLSTSTTAPEFSYYISDWSTYSANTRGALSGIVTDIKLKFDSIEILSAITFIEDGTAPSILDKFATPANPTPNDEITVSVVASDTVFIYEVILNAVTYPAGFSDVDYTCTEEVSQTVYSYSFASLTEGYYLFSVIVSDGANTVTEYLPVSTITTAFEIRDIVLITSTETLASVSGYSTLSATYNIYENNTSQGSGSISAGWFSIAWTKESTSGTYIQLGLKFVSGTTTHWVNGSYSVSSEETISYSLDWNFGLTDKTVFVTGYQTLTSTYTIYEDGVSIGTGSVTSNSFWLEWTRQSSETPLTVDVAVKFVNDTTTIWANFSYTEVQLTVFRVQQWWMTMHLGVESYVEFYVKTTLENATIYVYDNGTLMTTVTEEYGGVFSYFWMNTGSGLHNFQFNITDGVTTFTRNRAYYIPDWASTGLAMRFNIWTYQNNYTLLTLESNWQNCTFYVYLNGSIVATSANDPVTLNITRTMNEGTYNLTIVADGGTQTVTISNIRYIVTEEGVSYDYSSVTGGVQYVTNEGDVEEGDTTVNEGISGDTMLQIMVTLVAIIFGVAILVSLAYWWKNRKFDELEYRLAVAGNG